MQPQMTNNQMPGMMVQPQAQMQQINQQQQYGEVSKNGWNALVNIPGIFIKQKFEKLEALTGGLLEGQNSYYVIPCDANGEELQGVPALWKAKEQSSCCCRFLCPGNARSYRMNIQDINNKENIIINSDRKFKCTFLCCFRPELILYEGNDQSKIMGKIVNTYNVCVHNMDIFDGQGVKKFSISASIFSLGILCGCLPCKSCQEVTFTVKDASGEVLTHMRKRKTGCCKACVSTADYFSLVFPKNATANDRALLMMATLMIDYQFFENQTKDPVPI